MISIDLFTVVRNAIVDELCTLIVCTFFIHTLTGGYMSRLGKGVFFVLMLYVVARVIISCGAMNSPESSGKFEMTGRFMSAKYSGSQWLEQRSENFNTWEFTLLLEEAEYQRVDGTYTDWTGWKSGPVFQEDGVVYARQSTGNWCGNLPPQGALVHVNSPSGYTRDVVITLLETGEKFQHAGGDCTRQKFLFHRRIYDRFSGYLREETIIEATDWSDARRPYDLAPHPELVFQTWKDGEATPTPYMSK